MQLDASQCFAALQARDPRFDGLFFVGVRSTGIYCRPICPARTPARARCRFYTHPAAAERAGFRPCLRCRPELAPGRAGVDARSRLVRDASARIDAGFLDDHSVAQLATQLGVSARHLRRTLEAELGAAPRELAATRRLAHAKRLLQDTQLPMASVAFAAGYSSVRRFNACVRASFGQPPSALRRQPSRPDPSLGAGLCLRLDYRPPLDWPALLRFLAERAIPGVEEVRGSTYRRTLALGEARGVVELRPDPRRARVQALISTSLAERAVEVVARLRALCDLDAEPARIERDLARDPILAELISRHPGLRVPGAVDPFELAVRAILGQQVSVAAATTLATRLVEHFGERLEQPDATLRAVFPGSHGLARVPEAKLRALGLPRTRARSIASLAAAMVEGLRLDGDPEDVEARLRELPGVGPWTAAYICMRARPWPDALPAGDLVLRRVLGQPSARACARAAETWRPWRAYATMHLWTRARDRSEP